jgi:site-specific recombinase XerD
MRTLNKSEKTIDWYHGAIEDFCRFLEEVYAAAPPARLADFTLEHVRDYSLYLRGRPAFAGHPFVAARERPLSDASVNCYVRGLRGFASWLYEQEYTDVNHLGRLKAPKMTKKTVDILNDEEIARILARAADANRGPRATPLGRQARPAPSTRARQAGPCRLPHPRRYGLCPARPRRDGGAIHSAG